MTNGADLSVDPDFFELLTGSFARIVGRPLLDPGRGAAWLYEDAPFVVLAHNKEADPHFIYANRAAQERFGYDWSQFVRLPSRLSAEVQDRDERQRLLDAVAKNGFIADYRGMRVRSDKRRFWMEDGIVWQLVDTGGNHRGQAATFSRWTDIED